MKSQRSIVRRASKARARTKDYTRRRHINANVPTLTREEKVDKYKHVGIDSQGRAKLEAVGRKTILVKEKDYLFKDPMNPKRPLTDEYRRDIGMIPYPKRRKFAVAK